MHFTVITDHLLQKALKEKSVLTGRLLCEAEKLMEYNFDVVYQDGREHVVPEVLSRIYLVNITVSERIEEDCWVAAEKNKVYIPYEDRSRLLEQAHRLYTGHFKES